MGQKINPIGFRLGINRTWDSRWFASDDKYADLLIEDIELRDYLENKLKSAGISRIVIERAAKKINLTIYTARPGIIIGKKGSDIEALRRELATRTGKEISINLMEIRKPEIDAKLVAEGIANQLERRVSYRRAMKRGVQSALRMGAEGIRVRCAGRLAGADIAREERYLEGRVPLHTLRANIDYGFVEADTTYGQIGVKVWIYKGDIMEHDPMARENLIRDQQPQR